MFHDTTCYLLKYKYTGIIKGVVDMLLKNYKIFIEDRMMTVEDWEGCSLTNNNTGSGHVIILESCVSKYIEQQRPSLSG